MTEPEPIRWLASTIGKRGYIARYLRSSSPEGSVVVGTGNDPFTPGFASCDRAYVLPSISDKGYQQELLRVCDTERITAAVTLSDLDVPVLADLRHELVLRGVACFFPAPGAASLYLDKGEAAALWSASGIPTPPTFADLPTAIEALEFPIVIKPRFGYASKGVRVVESEQQAEERWKATPQPIAQEYVPGPLVNVEICSDQYGDPVAGCVWRKLRSAGGETTVATTVHYPEAIDLALRLLALVPVPGPVDLDLVETADGLVVLECNTRFGGGYPMSHLAGADFAVALARASARRPQEFNLSYQVGVTMVKDFEPRMLDATRVIRL